MALFIDFFMNDNKLLSHTADISQHINITNHKTRSYDKIRKLMVNLVSKKGDNFLIPLPNLLIIVIIY